MDMAMESYIRAYQPDSNHRPIGLGITASVATTEIHRGEHRIHAAVMSDAGMFVKTVILEKGVGPEARERDGVATDELGLQMLLDASAKWVPTAELQATREGCRVEEAYDRFLSRAVFWADGTRGESVDREVGAIFPGAFNPPHDGHFGISKQVPGDTLFAVTVDPPHKAALSLPDVLRRVKRMRGANLVFTKGDALYIDKARQNPGKAFVVGADALIRMLDPKWGVEVEPLLEEFTKLRTLFYVVGREVEGKWQSMNDVLPMVPAKYRERFLMIEGRWDVSSTELRQSRSIAS